MGIYPPQVPEDTVFVCKWSHFGLDSVHVGEGVWDCMAVNVGMKG